MSGRPTPTTADWARRYIETFNLALVPIEPGEKGPKVKVGISPVAISLSPMMPRRSGRSARVTILGWCSGLVASARWTLMTSN